jgi:hypothetical protein
LADQIGEPFCPGFSIWDVQKPRDALRAKDPEIQGKHVREPILLHLTNEGEFVFLLQWTKECMG